mmetsp:Transcript_30598/g.99452  ORF Transcript_30598/g.99452 Transcript_30598/m.99452 type:complete len:217 (+) Transcript_30598:352-1002(+)
MACSRSALVPAPPTRAAVEVDPKTSLAPLAKSAVEWSTTAVSAPSPSPDSDEGCTETRERIGSASISSLRKGSDAHARALSPSNAISAAVTGTAFIPPSMAATALLSSSVSAAAVSGGKPPNAAVQRLWQSPDPVTTSQSNSSAPPRVFPSPSFASHPPPSPRSNARASFPNVNSAVGALPFPLPRASASHRVLMSPPRGVYRRRGLPSAGSPSAT